MAVVANLPGHQPFEIPDNNLELAQYYIGVGADVIPGVTLAQAEQAAVDGALPPQDDEVVVEDFTEGDQPH